jgi:hypothetical protein
MGVTAELSFLNVGCWDVQMQLRGASELVFQSWQSRASCSAAEVWPLGAGGESGYKGRRGVLGGKAAQAAGLFCFLFIVLISK